jgi:hypothetical protein
MSQLPDVREIARRYNAACEAFDAALSASQARDSERHDAGLLQSAREMGSVLEIAVRRRVGLEEPRALAQLRELEFPQLVDKLRVLVPRSFGDGLAQKLKQWRNLRNRAEHYPIRVPSLRDLLDALRGTRRFLLEAFGPLELADPDHPAGASSSPPRAAPPASPSIVASLSQGTVDDTHRSEGPDAWIGARLEEGISRLNAGRSEDPPFSIHEVHHALVRAAWTLAERGAAPDEPIPPGALGPAAEAHRRLYVEAGWLAEEGVGLRFADPRLPALLVGMKLAGRGSAVSGFRRALGARRRWSETAWAATASGDLPVDWLLPLLDAEELEGTPDRVVSGAAALAGLAGPHDRRTAELLERVVPVLLAGLVWLVPLDEGDAAAAWDAWHLERDDWQRAAMDLAGATRDLAFSSSELSWENPGGSLGRLVGALGLGPRLPREAARALMALGRPWPQAGASPLDGAFFDALFEPGRGALERRAHPLFLETWLREVGVRALRRGDPRRAERVLVVPGPGHAAAFLLASDALLFEWCEAWECFAEVEPAEEAAAAWVHAATRVARSGRFDDAVADFLLRHAPERLRALGAWEAARGLLTQALSPSLPPSEPDARQGRYAATLFALAGLSADAWRSRIEAWGRGRTLPWRLLVEAGAPHDAVARWCLAKMELHDDEETRLAGEADGAGEPAGVEARAALGWLLDHGDERAVEVLADACFEGGDGARFDPLVRTPSQPGLRLSQVLWGRVLERAGGRAAFYARAERGALSADTEHFLPAHDLLVLTDGVWEAIAFHLSRHGALARRGPDDEPHEVARLLAAFERWMGDRAPSALRSAPAPGAWADAELRAAKTVVVFCAALHGLDVTGPLHALLRGVIDDADPRETELLVVLGAALDLVCQGPREPPADLLALAATPHVASRLAHDEARAFWATLLRHVGVAAVVALVEGLGLPDAGLGLFDALAAVAPDWLAEHQDRPYLARGVLVRAAEGRFAPSREFHEAAWARARRVDEIPELDRVPAGDWLRRLLERSRSWEASDRRELLRWLATRSRDAEVRRRCLDALARA